MKKLLLFLLLLPCFLSAQVIPLDGSASHDNDGSIASSKWRLVSGPGIVNIANSTANQTTVTAVWLQGIYVFELGVTDNKGGKATSQKRITVIPNPDLPPMVNAGADFSVQLSAKFTVTGSATDVNGNATISSYQWTTISAPNTPVFSNAGAAVTDITNPVVGVYTLRLKVTDNGGASAADTIQVIVTAANQLPVSNAGPDVTITLPVNSVSLGKPDPQATSYTWNKISGPTGGSILSPTSDITQVTGLSVGSYEYERVDRNMVGVSSDRVLVTVKSAQSCTWWQKLFHINGCRF